MNEPLVEISLLRREFREKVALRSVSLKIPRGGVYGLVGGNGAGKTTLIRHILGLFQPQFGTVRVFGLDPCAAPERVLAKIGYLSEDRDLPQWMRVDELVRYTRAFYPDWDPAYADELTAAFDLPTTQKVKSLSRGQLARLGLLLALAHRPELLVLDEPSSGLDPVVRRDILAAVIRTVADEGRTVLFSSHLLDEVERVADRVCMLHAGRVVLDDTVENIKATHRVVTIRFPASHDRAPTLEGCFPLTGGGAEWKYLARGDGRELAELAGEQSASLVDETSPTLDDVFVGQSGGRT
jgi:ABC-2 type transport system ATP-binding protein